MLKASFARKGSRCWELNGVTLWGDAEVGWYLSCPGNAFVDLDRVQAAAMLRELVRRERGADDDQGGGDWRGDETAVRHN